jgi:excisionase family DNA binding protein
MNQRVTIDLSLDEFKNGIQECVSVELTILLNSENGKKLYPQMLSVKELTEMLRVSKVTILNWTKQGVIKGTKIERRVFYKKQDLEECLKNYQHLNMRKAPYVERASKALFDALQVVTR